MFNVYLFVILPIYYVVFYIKAEGENKWLFPNSTKVKTIQAKKRKIGRSDLEQFVNVVIFSIMHIKPIRLIDWCLMTI